MDTDLGKGRKRHLRVDDQTAASMPRHGNGLFLQSVKICEICGLPLHLVPGQKGLNRAFFSL